MNKFVVGCIGVAAVCAVTQGAFLLAGYQYRQDFTKQILYSVDSINQEVMREGLLEAKASLAESGINEASGSSCYLFQRDKFCDVGNWVETRLNDPIAIIEAGEVEEYTLTKIKDGLTNVGDSNQLYVDAPPHFFFFWLAKGNVMLAFLLQVLSLSSLVGCLALVVVVLSLGS